jgi:hypothetical protein
MVVLFLRMPDFNYIGVDSENYADLTFLGGSVVADFLMDVTGIYFRATSEETSFFTSIIKASVSSFS